jgi:hypothetical protein
MTAAIPDELIIQALNYYWAMVLQSHPAPAHLTCGRGEKTLICADQVWFQERIPPSYLATIYSSMFDNLTGFEASYKKELDCEVIGRKFPPADWMLSRMQGCLNSPNKTVNISTAPCAYPSFYYDLWFARHDGPNDTTRFSERIIFCDSEQNGSRETSCKIHAYLPEPEKGGWGDIVGLIAIVGVPALAALGGIGITAFCCQRHKAKKWLKANNPEGSYLDYLFKRKVQPQMSEQMPLVNDSPKKSYTGII